MNVQEMTKDVVLRAWKDEGYRRSLPGDLGEHIPPRPENLEQLSDEQLEQAAGGVSPTIAVVGAVGTATGALGGGLLWYDSQNDDPSGPG